MIPTTRTHLSFEEPRVACPAVTLSFVYFLGLRHCATTTMASRIVGYFRGYHLYESFSANAPRSAAHCLHHAGLSHFYDEAIDETCARLGLWTTPSKSMVPIFLVTAGTTAEGMLRLQRAKTAGALPALSPKPPRAAQSARHSSGTQTATLGSTAEAFRHPPAPSNGKILSCWQRDVARSPEPWKP